MRRQLFLLGLIGALGATALMPTASAAQDEWAVGTWQGSLVAGPQTLEIVFHVTRGDDGALTGTMDVPTQGAAGIPLTTVVVEGESLTMTFPVPGGGSYEGTLDGEAIAGTFTQGPASFPMSLERGEAQGPPARPQEPQPPFPYGVEDVVVPNPDAGIEMAGTITTPEGPGPFPGVILVSGSGPQDRDEALMGHKPFLVLADHLTRAGIAVLRYDDRGVGGSTGDFASATSEDFASDALHALRFLSERANVDAARVGIVGHSEGGLVGPLAANRSTDPRFIVMLAGPGVPGLDILVEQGKLIARALGAPESMIEFNAGLQSGLAAILAEDGPGEATGDRMRSYMRAEIATLPERERAQFGEQLGDAAIDATVAQMNSAWFQLFLEYDPRDALSRLTVPVLAVFGGKDLQVPPEQSADEVETALARAGNRDATVVVLPGLNHLFQEAETGHPGEYQQIEETMSPVALETVSSWILERFGTPSR